MKTLRAEVKAGSEAEMEKMRELLEAEKARAEKAEAEKEEQEKRMKEIIREAIEEDREERRRGY